MPATLSIPTERRALFRSTLSDSDLVSHAMARDRFSFDELMRRHQDGVRSLALRMTKNAADADDVTQDTFLRVYTRLHTFDRERGIQFKTWLFTIARNTAFTHAVREGRKRVGGGAELDCLDSLAQEHCERWTDELASALRIALGSLSAEDRETLRLRYWVGLTFEEMAKSLGCALSTAARRHSIALSKLSKILDRAKYKQ